MGLTGPIQGKAKGGRRLGAGDFFIYFVVVCVFVVLYFLFFNSNDKLKQSTEKKKTPNLAKNEGDMPPKSRYHFW